MPEITTLGRILPILRSIYGKGSMVDSLGEHLAEKIDTYAPKPDDYEDEDRERMIMLTCWNWFSGGSTAGIVAAKIEEALS